MAVTYQDLYIDGTNRIEPWCADKQEARLEVRDMICAVAGKTKEEFTRDRYLYTTDAIAQQVEAMFQRREQGEPVEYILGEKVFCGLPFSVNPSVLIPRTDTEVLANLAIRRAKKRTGNLRVLDLCAGSGCVGITIAHQMKNVRAVLVDLSDGALELCKRNIRRHKLTGRVVYVKGDAMQPPSHALGQFDLLVTNPPYIPTADIPGLESGVRDYEPHMALDGGPDGLAFYRAISQNWKAALRPGGLLMCEVGIGQSEWVAYLLLKMGYQDICITRDSAHIDRVVEGRVPVEREAHEPCPENEENAENAAGEAREENAGQKTTGEDRE